MKNTTMENTIMELSPELLEAVNGGAMTEKNRAMILDSIDKFKAAGIAKEDILRILAGLDSWQYEEYQNGEDYNDIVNLINEAWVL